MRVALLEGELATAESEQSGLAEEMTAAAPLCGQK